MNWRSTAKDLARPSGVIVLSAAGPALGSLVALGLAVANADALRGSGLGTATWFVLLGALCCGLALLPTHVLSLVCGWAFGLPLGLAVALAGATLGSPLGYMVSRTLAGPGMMLVVERNPRGAGVCQAITRSSPARAGLLIGLLRLSPVVPYGSTNVLAAVFNIPIPPFILGTLIGLAPRAAAVVVLGAGLERLDSDTAISPWWIGVGIAATVLAISLMGWAAKRAMRQMIKSDLSPPPA